MGKIEARKKSANRIFEPLCKPKVGGGNLKSVFIFFISAVVVEIWLDRTNAMHA